MSLIVACGLRREARIIVGAGRQLSVVIGGGDFGRLEAELTAAADARAGIVLSFGLAGALDPSLRAGDIVVDGAPELRERLGLAIPHARVGRIVGSNRIVATAARKRALAAETGAIAADMETHVAARVAAKRFLPFCVLRAISDTADEDLPPAALVGMRPDGGVAMRAVLASLLSSPKQLPALVRTGRQAERALRSLAQATERAIAAGFDRIEPADLRLSAKARRR